MPHQPNWKRNTTFFLGGQVLSLFGSSLVQCAMSWYITLQTQSGAMLTIAMICGFLPTFLISPIAGVWADRYNRKRLIMLADGMTAIVTLGLAFSFFIGYRDVRLFFVVMAIRGLGQGIQQPAVNAFLPSIVPQEQLMRVNGINGSAQSVMMLLSPMLAGAMMAFAPIEAIFFIDVATAAIAILLLGFFVQAGAGNRVAATPASIGFEMITPSASVSVEAPVSDISPISGESPVQSDAPVTGNASVESAPSGYRGYFNDFKQGLAYIRGHVFVRKVFLYNAGMMLLTSPVAVLYGLQVTRLFGKDAWRLSVTDVSFSVGMLLGGLLLMSWGGFRNRHTTISLGMTLASIGTILCGVLGVFWQFIALMVFIGAAIPLLSTPMTVLLQENVEPEYHGRVFSFSTMLASLAMPMGLLLFGPMADVIGLSWLFIATGGIQLILSLGFTMDRKLSAVGRRTPTTETVE